MEITAASKGKPGACAACGDTPVAHLPTFLTSSFEAWIADRTERVSSAVENSMLVRSLTSMADTVFDHIPAAAHMLGLARVSRDQERACSYRSQVIWEEAQRRGIQMEQYILFGKPIEFYRARIKDRWSHFQSLPVPPHCWNKMYPGIDDKRRLKRFLSERGIPVSEAACVTSLSEARAIFERMRKPLVIKPRIGSRARHTTTNIWTLEEFDAAFKSAKTLCRYVLIEEHLDGAVSRATVVDGRLRGFLQMFPARVTGDGVHTIRELVGIKNDAKAENVHAIELDAEHRSYLKRSGYTPESVLEAGKTIDLSRRTGRFEGGATRELIETVHPALRQLMERAAHALSAPVVGFDLIIADPESDPDSQRWAVLEANSLPYIDLHYFPLYGEPSNIAAHLWDLAEGNPVQA